MNTYPLQFLLRCIRARVYALSVLSGGPAKQIIAQIQNASDPEERAVLLERQAVMAREFSELNAAADRLHRMLRGEVV